eukprot:1436675-Pleurochrysis_carterae.AAC.1
MRRRESRKGLEQQESPRSRCHNLVVYPSQSLRLTVLRAERDCAHTQKRPRSEAPQHSNG